MRADCDEGNRPLRATGLMAACPVSPPAEMTIISLEEWTTSFAIRWWFATPQPSTAIDLLLQDGLHWSAVDQTGASYIGGDFGGGGGNSPRWVASTIFAPALPANWDTITLRVSSPIDGTTLVIPLVNPRHGALD